MTHIPDEWLSTTEPGLSADSFFYTETLNIAGCAVRIGYSQASHAPYTLENNFSHQDARARQAYRVFPDVSWPAGAGRVPVPAAHSADCAWKQGGKQSIFKQLLMFGFP